MIYGLSEDKTHFFGNPIDAKAAAILISMFGKKAYGIKISK